MNDKAKTIAKIREALRREIEPQRPFDGDIAVARAN